MQLFYEYQNEQQHNKYWNKQKRSTEGCSKFKSPETRQVQASATPITQITQLRSSLDAHDEKTALS